jgi:hypothetical protein
MPLEQKHYCIFENITNALTPWSRVLPDKLTVSQLVKKFSTVDEIQRFITMFTKSRHLSSATGR